jgi:phosphatidylglycerophosphatase A
VEKRIAYMIATWFYSGLIPSILFKGMAGTYGSLAALPLCYATLQLGLGAHVIVACLVYAVGAWSIPYAETALGTRADWRGKAKSQDQNEIVIDEVLGMLVATTALFWMPPSVQWYALCIAFVLFRVFDVWKIPPARYFDELKSPFGIMFDDVIAGAWACLITPAVCTFLAL